MKKFLLSLAVIATAFFGTSQDDSHSDELKGKTLPSVKIENLDGELIDISAYAEEEGPVIINFWATWCSPCKKELNTIHTMYEDWVDETGVKLVAVSLDDERTKARVEPYVNGKAWDYEILLDPNGDLKRAMGVGNPPHTFVVYEGKIVFSHNGYAPGDEEELYDFLVGLTTEN